MARAKAVREAEKRLKGDLLTALLQEDITPRDANLWVRRMGLNLNRAHAAIRFAWDSASPPSLRRLETLVNGEVAEQALKVLVEPLGSEVVCICQEADAARRPERALSLAVAVTRLAGQEYPDIPMRSGIGLPAGEISLWRDSFRQAGQALEMARRLGSREPQYYPDLSVYRLLLQLEHHPDLHTFRSEILGSLLSYEGGGDLLKTLEAYFEHNGNLSQAAESLYIHRNTLTYRMERIAEISGLDLDHNETRLAVQLALRIHRMLESND
jgi:purine catabolism regulator